jgi:hypothetical protein
MREWPRISLPRHSARSDKFGLPTIPAPTRHSSVRILDRKPCLVPEKQRSRPHGIRPERLPVNWTRTPVIRTDYSWSRVGNAISLSAAQGDARRYTCTASPFVQHDPSRARATVPLGEKGYDYTLSHVREWVEHSVTRRTFYHFRPSLPAVNLSLPQPTAARVGARVRCDYYVFCDSSC